MHNTLGKIMVGAAVVFAGLPISAHAQTSAVPVESRQASASGACATDNALWIGTNAGGANCLDTNGFQSYSSETNQLTSDSITGIAACGKSVYAVGADLNVYDGTSWTQPKTSVSIDLPNSVACDGKGGVYIGHFKGVSHYDGTNWTDLSSSNFGSDTSGRDLVKAVAVAPNGDLWVVTTSSIAVQHGTQWTAYEKGNGFVDYVSFLAVAIDSKGTAWALTDTDLEKFTGKVWQTIKQDNLGTPTAITIDSKDQVWVGTDGNGIWSFDGKNWTNYTHDTSKLSSDHVGSLAFDAQGRLWAGTKWGLSVFDGKTFTSFFMGNTDLLDNNVLAVFPVGKGPTTLPTTKDKQPGTLGGIVLNGSDPIVGTRVQLCPEGTGFMFSGDTPCESDPYSQIIKTGSDGSFKFTGLLPGRYAFVLYNPNDKKWISLQGDSYGSGGFLVNEGKDTQVGDIDVKKAS